MMIQALSVLVVLMVTSPQDSSAINPGLKIRVSQTGLDYAAKVLVDVLAGQLQGQKIPDQSGSSHVAVGKVDWQISGMQIGSFGKPSATARVNPGSGITVSLTGASASVHGDWRYKYKKWFVKISDHGSFDVSASGATISLYVHLGRDASGRPNIQSTGCSSHVSNVKVKFHGGASWLYNIFKNLVEHPLKSNLEKVMCSSAKKAIDDNANKQLAKLKLNVVMEKLLDLDYSLTAPPAFQTGHIDFFHKGEVFWRGTKKEAPFQPAAMPEPGIPNKMINIWASDYIMHSLGLVLHNHRLLTYQLSKNDLPEKQRGRLDMKCSGFTMCIGGFLNKEVVAKFPNASVELAMASDVAPTMKIAPSGINGSFSGDIVWSARNPDGSLHELFTTTTDIGLILSAALVGERIKAKVSQITTRLDVTKSLVGPVKQSGLNFVFKTAAQLFIEPQLNKIGEKGFELPSMEGVTYVNPVFELLQGSLFLSTDVTYDPSHLSNKLFWRKSANRMHKIN